MTWLLAFLMFCIGMAVGDVLVRRAIAKDMHELEKEVDRMNYIYELALKDANRKEAMYRRSCEELDKIFDSLTDDDKDV
jgi:uncharacterized membrane-anchored protein YhcB (DUF1043 family)